MKILKLRGCNLASLADDFEVDFESAPLATAGLYAISGPTGAGKSTLLDALCVALFDRTPRLSDHGGVPIGREDEDADQRLGSNDVRSILRRGAGFAHAEVEFVGVDGLRYRSSWHVERAHKRSDGRLQDQKLELRQLPVGITLGDTKTQTLELIETKLGLTYDQFRRSVLLAQGEFAAFLKASAKERAELLEKMTGTEIYARLSVAAHERAREGRDALTALQDQVAALAVLSAVERSSLEADRDSRQETVSKLTERQQEAQHAHRWYETRSRLMKDEVQAAMDVDEAHSRRRDADLLRTELEEVTAVEHLRTPLELLLKAEGEVTHARTEDAASARNLDEATASGAESQEAVARAEKQLEDARNAERDAQPGLEKARELDARVTRTASELAVAAQTVASVESELVKANEAIVEAEQRVGTKRDALEASTRWLGEREPVDRLHASWERTRTDVLHWGELRKQGVEFKKKLADHDQEAQDAEQRYRNTADGVAAARASLEAAEVAVHRAEEEFGDSNLARLRNEAMIVSERKRRFAMLRVLAAQASDHSSDERLAREEQEKARQRCVAARETITGAEDALSRLGQQLATTDDELRRANAIRDLAHLRTELRPDEPCPLCGSVSHPGPKKTAIARGPARLQEQVDKLREQVTDAERKKSGAESLFAEAEDKAKSAAGRLKRSRERLVNLRAQWETERKAIDEVQLPSDAASPEAVGVTTSLTGEAQNSESQLERKVQSAERLDSDLQEQRRHRDQIRNELDRLETLLRGNDRAQREHVHARQLLTSEIDRIENDMRVTLQHLGAAFAGRDHWQRELDRSPEAFVERCETELREWRAHKESFEAADRQLRELSGQLSAYSTNRARLSALVEDRRAVHREQDALHTEAARARAGILDGKPTLDVEAQLRRALGEALERVGNARRDASSASSALAAARARRDQARDRLAQCEQAYSERRQSFDGALGAVSLDLETVRRRLGRDPEWVKHTRESVAGVDRDYDAAVVRLEERQRLRREHEAHEHPKLEAESVEVTLEELEDELSFVQEDLLQLRGKLNVDDERRNQLDALHKKIEEQKPLAERWNTLAALIGSADGSVFRRFAQSMTLDAMLVQANEHLKELVPRYRLARVPSEELELQIVDYDMAGDVRTINTLSGGETFLVSLALALGLSSLSSRGTRIESLFIDEGLGFLDQRTLDVALAVLDALQASGRKVGLISHVPGIADRIGIQVMVTPEIVGRSRVVVQGPV